MPDYALIKNGKVENVIVADQSFVDAFLQNSGDSLAIVREGNKGNIGQKYHDGKFWRDVHDICPGGMIHDGQTEVCQGGEELPTTHEEEVL